jgi:hypothetical protein
MIRPARPSRHRSTAARPAAHGAMNDDLSQLPIDLLSADGQTVSVILSRN